MIPQGDALTLQLAAIVGSEPASSLLEIRPLTVDGRPAPERAFIPVRQAAEAKRRIVELAPHRNVFIGVAPRVRPEGKAAAVARVWTLWADIDTAEDLAALRSFDPAPSIVIESGSGGVHAYWPSRRPLSPADAQRCNRRIALALGGDMNATDPARILRPAGTLNHKHDPARAVACTRLELQTFDALEVVGKLPDSSHYARRRPQVAPGQTAPPERVLDGLARTVREAQEGNRNAALFWATCRCAERVDAGELEEATALPVIHQAALDAGLPDAEIRATIRSGLSQRVAA